MSAWLDALTGAFTAVQLWLFEALVQPVMFGVGLASVLEDGYAATGWLLVGLLQMAVLVLVIGPLQRWRPVEPVRDRATIRTDMLYTVLHRLGFFRLLLFFTLGPLFDTLFGAVRVAGWQTLHLDAVWPGVTDQPLVALVVYLVVFDFFDYWVHRAQHHFPWWWSLHALHHAQRQMTMWSDNRNHVLDDVLRDCLLVVLAQTIGIAPGEFVAVVAITQLSESFQHANVRIWFGPVGERLWISPRFHRLHHAVGIGHETTLPERVVPGGHNFGVLLPWWDMLFGTANFELRFEATGVRDQVEQGRDYGQGFWRQQWLGVLRLGGRA